MIRLLFLLHRYLGISVGLLMLMWCASGIVMMYVSYPALSEQQRVAALPMLSRNACCHIAEGAFPTDLTVNAFQVEMLAGRPIIRISTTTGIRVIDLNNGALIPAVSPDEARRVAATFQAQKEPRLPTFLGPIDFDQWTVGGSFQGDRPLYQYQLNDAVGTEVYVSSTSGKAIQRTTRHERFWNWLGAVPHWLYFAKLRRNPSLWGWLVIGTSLAGSFLAAIGLYLGVRQFVPSSKDRCTPYRGLNAWHHIAGLVFGLFTLTWVVSGLLSMNPWGWLEVASAASERRLLAGEVSLSRARVETVLQVLIANPAMRLLSVEGSAFEGHLYLVGTAESGERQRYSADGLPNTLSPAEVSLAANLLSKPERPLTAMLLTEEDQYYFSHHRDAAPLPVYRLASADGADPLYYLDPVAGTLLAKVDSASRVYRWLHEGLHRMDFSAWLRRPPQWYAAMLVLMTGVTVTCGTGAYLGYRRLKPPRPGQTRV